MCGEKPPGFETPGRPRGITPACAGKSVKVAFSRKMFQDHPRMCGEKYSINTPPSMAAGSPPHVRGKAFARLS